MAFRPHALYTTPTQYTLYVMLNAQSLLHFSTSFSCVSLGLRVFLPDTKGKYYTHRLPWFTYSFKKNKHTKNRREGKLEGDGRKEEGQKRGRKENKEERRAKWRVL